ncbi:MAG: M18 family aminopeptidase [Clostridia bacterium]|nr:M18 family aminopeptidase [Clostridia bacterium]
MNVETLLDLIHCTPTPWHAAENVKGILCKRGFSPLASCDLDPVGGGDWFTLRNGTGLIAFRIPDVLDPSCASFRISAVHGDSPCWRVKPNGMLKGAVTRLNTERYGGGIDSTWMDVPLGLAGRVMVRTETGLAARLVYLDRPVAVIPNTAPHLRSMNEGLKLDPKCDLIPLFGDSEAELSLVLAEELAISPSQIAGWDLSLVCCDKGFTFGPKGEFVTSPRLDDLECVYTCLDGFLSAKAPENVISVFALFDNEETGSLSFAGAAGTLLRDTLARILPDEQKRQSALARSFFVSADNAHALHPNHPELYDGQNAPVMNGGVVIKYNASQRYMSDGFSGAVFAEICKRAQIPVQVFANRSDLRGGSTLGSLSEAQVPVRGVDIGAAQLAMHSARETAGSRDVEYLSRAMTAFYEANFTLSDDGIQWN